jgi:hypothetical protein
VVQTLTRKRFTPFIMYALHSLYCFDQLNFIMMLALIDYSGLILFSKGYRYN